MDYLDRQTTRYLTQIAHTDLNLQHSEYVVKLLHVPTDLEHTSDVVAKSLVALLVKRVEGDIEFSEEGQEELIGYHQLVLESYEHAIATFENDDTALVQTVKAAKSELDELEHTYRQTHYNELSRELQASMDSSHIHLYILLVICVVSMLMWNQLQK